MRIIAGAWRGRALAAPPGDATRPTADRVRQALFDMLLHAPWGGREAVEGTRVLDAFAGTGALGLEALSRGAAHATFIERDRAALAALRANVARCGATARSAILALDALNYCPYPGSSPQGYCPYPGSSAQGYCPDPGSVSRGFDLVFLDPPYGQGLIPRALARLRAADCLAAGALLITETGRDEAPDPQRAILASRAHGAALLTVWRET